MAVSDCDFDGEANQDAVMGTIAGLTKLLVFFCGVVTNHHGLTKLGILSDLPIDIFAPPSMLQGSLTKAVRRGGAPPDFSDHSLIRS